jgi:hypothetical protein
LIAEIGIAIAGFAGVIATLRAPGGRLGAYAALRIGTLLGFSVLAVLLALLPSALHFADLSTRTIWTWSSGMMAVLVVAVYFAPWRIAMAKTALPAPEDRAPGWGLMSLLIAGSTAGVAVLQLANVVFVGQIWPFYLGLLAITALSLLQFAYILFAPSRFEVPA